jgi:DNA-binding transcriptional ArsR family regulator
MFPGMARAATTADPWNAIAEPQRRRILTLLQGGERPAGEVASALRMAQPQASKHLRVLREVGLLRVREVGPQRLYALDARGLRPIHEWTGGFERWWSESFARLDAFARELHRAARRQGRGKDDEEDER